MVVESLAATVLTEGEESHRFVQTWDREEEDVLDLDTDPVANAREVAKEDTNLVAECERMVFMFTVMMIMKRMADEPKMLFLFCAIAFFCHHCGCNCNELEKNHGTIFDKQYE